MIHEWCNRWCMLLNPSETDALVVSYTSRTLDPPHSELVLSEVPIRACSNIDASWCAVWLQTYMFSIVTRVSQCIGNLRLVKSGFENTSVLLVCYYEFVLQILE